MDKVSDIKKVNKLSKLIYKKSVEPSTRKNKKYMILNDVNKLVLRPGHLGNFGEGDARHETTCIYLISVLQAYRVLPF